MDNYLPSLAQKDTPIQSLGNVSFHDSDNMDSININTLEESLAKGMQEAMIEAVDAANEIKEKTGYSVLTLVGDGRSRAVIFSTPVTKDIVIRSSGGKETTRKIVYYGVMTEKGNMALRLPTPLRTKIEDALMYSANTSNKDVGFMTMGDTQRLSLKVPKEFYGEENVLNIPYVESFIDDEISAHGFDLIRVNMEFINNLMELTLKEASSFKDFEESKKKGLMELKKRKDEELNKAFSIGTKLKTFHL